MLRVETPILRFAASAIRHPFANTTHEEPVKTVEHRTLENYRADKNY